MRQGFSDSHGLYFPPTALSPGMCRRPAPRPRRASSSSSQGSPPPHRRAAPAPLGPGKLQGTSRREGRAGQHRERGGTTPAPRRAGRHRPGSARAADWLVRRAAQPMGRRNSPAIHESQHGRAGRAARRAGPDSAPLRCRRPSPRRAGGTGEPVSAQPCGTSATEQRDPAGPLVCVLEIKLCLFQHAPAMKSFFWC